MHPGAALGRLLSAATLAAAAAAALSLVPAARHSSPQLAALHAAGVQAWALLRPGGAWHPAGFIEHHGHIVLEGCLLAVIAYLLVQSSAKPQRSKQVAPLTAREVEELCEEWEPEPLGGALTAVQRAWVDSPLVVTSPPGRLTTVNGRPALDLASANYLGLAGHPEIAAAAAATIRRLGVGACGPRGFYGTLDVHLELEAALSRFMGSQEAILYSYDLATLPSIIPAFADRKDVVVLDEACSFAVRNGAALSRARVLTFKHNDVADLEAVLTRVGADHARARRPLNRRFVVVEGVYANTGEVAPLAAIANVKERHRWRLIVDESHALGVLGPGGRGAAEAAGLAPADVEIVGAALGNAAATVGGFCSGDREIVDHQRLSGLGYCFSASLPPYLAAAGTAAIGIMEREGRERAGRLRRHARRFREALAAGAVPGLVAVGGPESVESPLVHLRLADGDAAGDGEATLAALAADCLEREDVLVVTAKYGTALEGAHRPPPSLRICLSAAHEEGDVERAVAALAASAGRVLGGATRRRAA